MGSKLTAGILVGALAVVGGSAYVATSVLGSGTVSEGNVAAEQLAAARSTDVARALTPPDDAKYSGAQLVAAALAAASSTTGVLHDPATAGSDATVTAVPVAWDGSTASTGGARVTVRIDARVVAHSGGLLGLESSSGGAGQRCFVYAVRDGTVGAVRSIRCPPAAEAMKLPKPAALPRST